jgi:hypothetical protein
LPDTSPHEKSSAERDGDTHIFQVGLLLVEPLAIAPSAATPIPLIRERATIISLSQSISNKLRHSCDQLRMS